MLTPAAYHLGLVAVDNTASLQFSRAMNMPNFTHIGSVVFQRSLRQEFFEWLNDDVESSASNGEFRPFPWGCYTYGEPLFKDCRTVIPVAKGDFQVGKVFPKL